jgi:hypothetical protein
MNFYYRILARLYNFIFQGIMDIDSYCLSDLPLSSPQPSNNINRSENTNQSKYLPILAKRVSLNNDYIKSIDKQQLLRRSTRISQGI